MLPFDAHIRQLQFARRAFRAALRSARGFTLVEALVTAGVATLGFAALTELQSKSLAGVREAHDLTVGTATAEHFIEMVRANSQVCAVPDGSAACSYLPGAGDFSGTWTRFESAGAGGSLFTLSPGVIDAAADGSFDRGLASEFPGGREQRYCLHYRTSWIVADSLFRVDARVLWPQSETDIDLFESCDLALVDVVTGQPAQVGVVTVSSAISRTGF